MAGEERGDSAVAAVASLLVVATPFVLHDDLGWAWAWTVGLLLGILVGLLFVVTVVTLRHGPELAWLWLRVWARERRSKRMDRSK